jgi:hypothetical protein
MTAYVAVKYRGYWFYIDDCDATSKLIVQAICPRHDGVKAPTSSAGGTGRRAGQLS